MLDLLVLHEPPVLLAPRRELNGMTSSGHPEKLLVGDRRLEEPGVAIILEELGDFHLRLVDELVEIPVFVFRLEFRVELELVVLRREQVLDICRAPALLPSSLTLGEF